jgi:gluconolactonase
MKVQANDIITYDNNVLNTDTVKIEKVATGFQFTEGPVWHPENYLLFSDIPANCIWQLFPDGTKKIYLKDSGFSGDDITELSEQVGSNGLAIDKKGNLIICQHGNHAIAMLDRYHVISVVSGIYEGRRYNSPNDLAIKSDGSIYFSDPPYGLKDQVHHPQHFQPGGGVYCYKDGEVTLLTEDLRYPNGVCFSPDESYLYVGSAQAGEAFVYRYEVTKSGELQHPHLLIENDADGIKTDRQGNLFLATGEGVLIVSPEGKRMAMIRLPETPANLAWVKPAYDTLYVTARSSIYRISGLG